MKIVILTADYPPAVWSGIGVAVHRQVAELMALGFDVQVIIHRPADGERVPEVVHADWIHLHSLPLTELALELRRSLGAKLAYTVHTQPWLELPDHPARRFWLDAQTRLFAACDRLIFLSRSEMTAARAVFRSLPPATVIPVGLPPSPLAITPREGRRGVIFAGRFASSKGILLLEQCMRRLIWESDLRLVIAGGHGDAEGSAAVERLARGHPGRCEITGWLSRDELDERLMQSELTLVPSRYEPFGLIAAESMRVGTPVLAANVGGLRELAGQGSGGAILDSTDPAIWANETLRLIRDRARWQALHRQGPPFVDRHYPSTELTRRLIEEVYQPEPTFCGVAPVTPT